RLAKEKQNYIVVEKIEQVAHTLKKRNHPVIVEDALSRETLESVNIDNAHALVSCLGSDGDNVVLVLLAREFNKSLPIIARANYPDVVERLKLVGATQIIMPEQLGGQRMAELITKR
ncbi:MAG: NAD(P)-binding protein, partial [Nanoarchaeota archaeon]